MVSITDSSLRANVFETLHDLATAITYGTDTEPTITAAYIDGSHAPYPQVVIEPADISKSDFTVGSDRSANTKNINVNVLIFTKKNKDLDVISDLLDTSITNTNYDGMTMIDSSEDVNLVVSNNTQKVRSKTLSYTFIRR